MCVCFTCSLAMYMNIITFAQSMPCVLVIKKTTHSNSYLENNGQCLHGCDPPSRMIICFFENIRLY